MRSISKLLLSCLLTFGALFHIAPVNAAEATAAASAARPAGATQAHREIEAQVAAYIRSIDAADPALGAKVFATTGDTSFTHPRGRQQGWSAIAADFYGETMGNSFTERTLRRVGDLIVKVYGNSAVVEFEWDFVAKRRDNGETLHTTGRESQVFIKQPRLGWRIVHVHYSGPPVTGAGQGF